MLWKEPATSFACNLEGVVGSLVARSVFKTDGGRIPSLVGSIPIYSRQFSKSHFCCNFTHKLSFTHFIVHAQSGINS